MNQLVEAWISSVLALFCVLKVMIQKHNISVLAVADTVALLIGNPIFLILEITMTQSPTD